MTEDQDPDAETASHRRRWPFVAAVVGIGVAAATVIKRRGARPSVIDLTEPGSAGSDADDAEATIGDDKPTTS